MAAPAVAGLYNVYSEFGLMTVTYLSENAAQNPAEVSDAQAWATNFNQDGLVLISSLQDVWYPFGIDMGGGSFGIALPGTMLVGPGMKIAKMGVPSNQEIELVLGSINP